MSLKNTIVVNAENVKRIAITCKCGTRFIESVPGEILESGALPIFECPTEGCHQSYIIRDGKLQRVPDLKKILLEDSRVAKEMEQKDVVEMGETPTPRNKDAWNAPGSKAVN